jgi:hypothetical protein
MLVPGKNVLPICTCFVIVSSQETNRINIITSYEQLKKSKQKKSCEHSFP